MLNGRKRRPTHPGAILREDIMPELGVDQTKLAQALGVSRRAVNEIAQERRAVSVDMAHRFARVFQTSPHFWLNLQQAVDVYEAFEAKRGEYEQIDPLPKSKAA